MGWHRKHLFSSKASLLGIVALQVVQHGLVGLGHRAFQPVHFKRPHRVSGPPATTLQFPGLVKVAYADPRWDFLQFEAKRASRDYRGGLLCVALLWRLGLDGIRGLLPVSRVISPLRAAKIEGNRFTDSVDRSSDGSRISWAYLGPKRRSACVRLRRSTLPWSLWMSTRPRRT